MASVVQQTKATLTLKGALASYSFTAEAAIAVGGEGLTFKGEIDGTISFWDLLQSLFPKTTRPGTNFTSFPNFDLKSPEFIYDDSRKTAIVRLHIDIESESVPAIQKLGLTFAFAKTGATRAKYIAGLRTTTPIRLADLAGGPDSIVGRLLGSAEISNLGVFYASAGINDELALFSEDADGSVKLASGPSFSARFGVPGSYSDIMLPPPSEPPPARSGETATTPEEETGTETPSAPEDKRLRMWFKVQKSFGPLEIRRIGGSWEDGRLGFLLDAGVELLALKVALAGLQVSVPPSKLTRLSVTDLAFALDGLEIEYTGGPVSIRGAFLKSPGLDEYSGMAMIRAANFTITAIGAYALTKTTQKPSLFIFGAFVGIIGGPPAFVVQGIAAGFGYNRGLIIPEVENVHEFPLVKMVMSPDPGESSSALEQLGGNHFPIMEGQYWLAAGVKFSSFKLIDAFALITVQFGTRFELALLGVATMQQPPKIEGTDNVGLKPFLFVELALSVRLVPDQGLFAARAVLTSRSYLFHPSCKLTGGFAFCIWFKPTDPAVPDHSGNFVLTFGGYHPRFAPPDFYPQAPRIGFKWQMPERGVTIKGECYFALTPTCLMGGCRLMASYRDGNFAAWFEAYADFLMAWEPFHYEADIGIWIGASYTLHVGELTSTISVQIGASLSIWGPEFAGEAYVNLGIIAFTVQIGAANVPRTAPAIEWEQFHGKFIPQKNKEPAPIGINIIGGLLREGKGQTAGDDTGQYIVSASGLSLTVETLVPVRELLVGEPGGSAGQDGPGMRPPSKPDEPKLGIRPMGHKAILKGKDTLQSSLTVQFRRAGGKLDKAMEQEAIRKNVPEALWGLGGGPSTRGNEPIEVKVIPNVLSGVKLTAPKGREPKPASKMGIGYDDVAKAGSRPVLPASTPPDAPSPGPVAGGSPEQTARDALGRKMTGNAGVREAALNALRGLGFGLSLEPIDLRPMVDDIRQVNVLLAPPEFVELGGLPRPRGTQ